MLVISHFFDQYFVNASKVDFADKKIMGDPPNPPRSDYFPHFIKWWSPICEKRINQKQHCIIYNYKLKIFKVLVNFNTHLASNCSQINELSMMRRTFDPNKPLSTIPTRMRAGFVQIDEDLGMTECTTTTVARYNTTRNLDWWIFVDEVDGNVVAHQLTSVDETNALPVALCKTLTWTVKKSKRRGAFLCNYKPKVDKPQLYWLQKIHQKIALY